MQNIMDRRGISMGLLEPSRLLQFWGSVLIT
jgi:hypothetical protein